ncbi:uncharacterized protein LOC142354252 [Convolutriloba macropyga]|uniref:uncharacterized protein LOC142354252 n=1 Tax=Convolutriloba macropyga TaxID=536237 RepID=UPI003F526CBA
MLTIIAVVFFVPSVLISGATSKTGLDVNMVDDSQMTACGFKETQMMEAVRESDFCNGVCDCSNCFDEAICSQSAKDQGYGSSAGNKGTRMFRNPYKVQFSRFLNLPGSRNTLKS